MAPLAPLRYSNGTRRKRSLCSCIRAILIGRNMPTNTRMNLCMCCAAFEKGIVPTNGLRKRFAKPLRSSRYGRWRGRGINRRHILHWRDYRDSLRGYTDDFIHKQTFLREIHEIGLPAFYARYEKRLREVSTDRVLNGAMAVILLHYLEEKPQRWEAVRWLNADPSPQGESFRDHLRRWYLATPEPQRETVSLLAELYGMKLSPSAESDR